MEIRFEVESGQCLKKRERFKLYSFCNAAPPQPLDTIKN